MEQLISDLVQRSDTTTLQLLRSVYKSTEVVREYVRPHADAASVTMKCFDLSVDSDEGITAAVAEAMSEGNWIYISNVCPEHDKLLRRVALCAFTADRRLIHGGFRIWLTTQTIHTSFEPPPIHSGVALPRVLLHLCNAPQSLLGDMDSMRIVETHKPDINIYDDDTFATVMAETAELLCNNDPSITRLCYEESTQKTQNGKEYFLMLPDAFKYNTSLTELDLTNCGIGEDGCKSLGRALKENKGITTINLSQNDIADSSIESLCYGLLRNKTLSSLDISRNTGIGSDGITILGTTLMSGSGLKELRLAQNNSLMKEHSWSRKALRNFFEGVSKSELRSLILEGCELSGHSATQLANSLSNNTKLTSLNISCNRIGDTGVIPLARMLKNGTNNTLTLLNLNDCCLGSRSFVSLGAALRCNTSLTSLSLKCSMPGSKRGYRSIKTDVEEDVDPTPMPLPNTDEPWEDKPDSDCDQADDTTVGMEILSEGLKQNRSLQSLYLGNCQLSDTLVEDLCCALTEVNETLTELDISGNHAIGDRGSQLVQTLLRGGLFREFSCSLRVANISDSSPCLGERSALALSVSPLEELLLSNVCMTDGIALSLRDAIINNTASRLRKLDLSCNSLFKEGFCRIGDILISHETLESVDLRNNLKEAHMDTTSLLHDKGTKPEGLSRFKDSGIDVMTGLFEALASLTPEKSSLKYLGLEDNTITDECIKLLLTSVEKSRLRCVVNLNKNHHTPSILPVVDGFASKNSLVQITIDEPQSVM